MKALKNSLYLALVLLATFNTMGQQAVLQQQVFGSGSDPSEAPASANFVLQGSVVGGISGPEILNGNYKMLPGYFLGITELNLTLVVDMRRATLFDHASDEVYVTGTMFDWALPGNEPQRQTMTRMEQTSLYQNSIALLPGEHQYKYFLNAGWLGGEWGGTNDRTITVEQNTTIYNAWGLLGEAFPVAFNVRNYLDEIIANAVVTVDGFAYDPNEYEIGYLPGNKYAYSVSADGYLTATGTFSVEDEPQMVEVMLVPDGYMLPYYQYFSALAQGEVPRDWDRTHNNWGVVLSDFAGGQSPEMRFNWLPENTGVSRLLTPFFHSVEPVEYMLAFKHKVFDYHNPPGGFQLKVQSTLDGLNWNDEWVLTPAGDIGPETVIISLAHLAGQAFQLSWVFEGNSQNINQWFIDDIAIEELPPDPALALEPAGWHFGNTIVGESSPPKEFTITNTGGGLLNVDAPTLDNELDFSIAFNQAHFPASLATGHSVNFSAAFNPRSLGSRNAQVSIDYNAGQQTATVALSGYAIYDDDPCLPPDWIPVTGMQFNMQVTAQIVIDEVVSNNPNNVLGAFVDGECRGIASPDPDQDGLVFLTISSNVPLGETVELVIWDSENCEPCQTWPTIEFVDLQQLGTPGQPYVVHCQGFVEFTVPMGEGFTWFSLNVDPGSMNVNDLLISLNPCQDDRVIGQTIYATYFNNQWIGSLSAIDPAWGYKMDLCSAQELNLLGAPVASPLVNLGAGFTWLGYTPQACLPVNTALADILPQPAEDDRIIGQTKFATYYQGSWVGSLSHLCPGEGYVIALSNASTLQYPEAGQKDMLAGPTDGQIDDPFRQHIVPNLQHTMTLVGQLTDTEGLVSLNENDAVFAIINEEIRGMARPGPAHNGLLFMSMGSNADAGELIRFSAWSDALKEFVGINETLPFQSLQHAGTVASPFVFTMSGAVGTDVLTADGWIIGDPYPNPSHGTVSIPYYISQPANVSLQLLNSLGHVVHKQELSQETPGRHKLELKKGALPRGVYFYKVLLTGAHNTKLKTGTLVMID